MEYYDLGTHSWPVTTSVPEAQTWFDRGLAWAYGFNHEEAVYCFEQALSADPDCAMAHWGVGYAHRAELQQALGGVRRGRPADLDRTRRRRPNPAPCSSPRGRRRPSGR